MAETEGGFDSQTFLRHVSSSAGVYQMFAADGSIIYIGKAKNLKKRLSSYFQKSHLEIKTATLVAQIAKIEVVLTATEVDALLLENNLIKRHRPRYNILLKDDKSYPMLRIGSGDFARMSYYRGSKNAREGELFGPFPSSAALKYTIELLQKIFKLRPCQDSEFDHRSRPCLQYQINRCKAPCVGLCSKEEYAGDIQAAKLFLAGRKLDIISDLAAKMERAATERDYERAAMLRDQIRALKEISQGHNASATADMDVIAVEMGALAVVEVHFVRDGQSLGSKTFFPKTPPDCSAEQVLSAFIGQYYLDHPAPPRLLVDRKLADAELLGAHLSQSAGKKVKILTRVTADSARWLRLARTNAQYALGAKLASKQGMAEQFNQLANLLNLAALPILLECFDISHTMGERTVASCVVFDGSGARKDLYRQFNIADITGGDDYAAMEQALTRRYQGQQQKNARLPDVLFIDGGKGQLARAQKVMQQLQIKSILLVGVAKGKERRAGEETIIIPAQNREFKMPSDAKALHLIQQIRDEAHRFAIGAHRKRRAKARTRSILEDIAGVGAKRRAQLLRHFGGIQGIMAAGIDDLAAVPGISRKLASNIYQYINTEKNI